MQTTVSRVVAAKPLSTSSSRPARRPIVALPRRRSVSAQAAKEFDFDQLLIEAANKFEKADNKPVIVGYGLGAAAAILTAEWFIHLPLLDALVGFPIQLLGLLSLPLLGIRYVIEKADPVADAEAALKKVTNQLPGLGKK